MSPLDSRFHFGTEMAWIETLRAWARSMPEVERIWILGSRAKGWRSGAHSPASTPDMDVGFTMTGPDMLALYQHVVRNKAAWRAQLETLIPVEVDLQYAEEGDALVWLTILDHGVLVYERRQE